MNETGICIQKLFWNGQEFVVKFTMFDFFVQLICDNLSLVNDIWRLPGFHFKKHNDTSILSMGHDVNSITGTAFKNLIKF